MSSEEGSVLNYQQQMVMERVSDNWGKTLKYNDDLDKRATLVTATSSIIVGIVTAAKFLPEHEDGLTAESVLLGLVCLCSVAMYFFALDVIRANHRAMPGSTDPNVLFDDYISLDADVAYNNSLIDLCDALGFCIKENDRKASALENIVLVFQCQLFLLAGAIAWSGIASVLIKICG